MTASDETRHEVAVETALMNANASQLRGELRRRAAVTSHYDDMTGQYIEGSPDSKVEDLDAYAEAVARWQRGDVGEALHHLELALGRDFLGLGELKP